MIPHQEAVAGHDMGIERGCHAFVNGFRNGTPHTAKPSLVDGGLIDPISANSS
jgi:hypothetical protein